MTVFAPDPAACAVLMHHYVRDVYTGAGIFGPTPAAFEAQGLELSRRLAPAAAASWRTAAEGGGFPTASWLLTFDDGLRDHGEQAFPVMRRHGWSGIFFIHTLPLLEGRLAAVHRIHLLRQAMGEDGFAAALAARLPPEWLPAAPEADRRDARLYRWDGPRLAALKRLLNHVLPYDVLDDALAVLFVEVLGDEAAAVARLHLSWEELAALQAAGAVIGGHGHAHRAYARLTPAEQEADLTRCRDALAERLGRSPWAFCYPFGKDDTYNDDTTAILRRLGYVCAFASEPGPVRSGDDPFRLRRFDPKDIPADGENGGEKRR